MRPVSERDWDVMAFGLMAGILSDLNLKGRLRLL